MTAPAFLQGAYRFPISQRRAIVAGCRASFPLDYVKMDSRDVGAVLVSPQHSRISDSTIWRTRTLCVALISAKIASARSVAMRNCDTRASALFLSSDAGSIFVKAPGDTHDCPIAPLA